MSACPRGTKGGHQIRPYDNGKTDDHPAPANERISDSESRDDKNNYRNRLQEMEY